MYFGYAVVGLIIGILLAGGGSASLLGAVGGAVLGLLFARVSKLEIQIRDLQSMAQARARIRARAAVPAKPKPEPEPEFEPGPGTQTRACNACRGVC